MKQILKYAAVVLAALSLALPAHSQSRKKVGVVLSGGGAKGVAHISALKVLEEAGIPIDYITGTSMGAIIGGLYSAGYDTHTLDSMVRSQDWRSLLSDRVSRRNMSTWLRENQERYVLTLGLDRDKRFVMPSGLVGGNNVYNLLTELTMDYHDSISFRSLPIPFACVAYDMVSGRTVVLNHGNLPLSIRASMSIPGAFEPVHIGNMILIDGGISNNFPADVLKDMGADIIIGVDVGAMQRDAEQIKSLGDMFNQITYFTGEQTYQENLKMVDLVIKPDLHPFHAGSFSAEAIDTMLVRGETGARDKWDELIALKKKIGISPSHSYERGRLVELDKPVGIDRVVFEGLDMQRENIVSRVVGFAEDTEISPSEIQQAVARLQGTGLFTEVSYRLEGSEAPYAVVFVVKEKSMNSIGVGIRFDTEEMAAILLNATFSSRKLGRSTFGITARLSENPYGEVKWAFGSAISRVMSLSYMFKYNRQSLYYKGDKQSNMDFGNHRIDLGFSNIRLKDFKMRVGLRYEYYDYHSLLTNDVWDVDLHSQGLVSYYFITHYESLDKRHNPRRGHLWEFGASLNTSNFINYKGDSPYAALNFDYLTAISVSRRVTFLPGAFGRVLIGENIAYPSLNVLGGTVAGRYMPQQIPFVGIGHFEQFDNAIVGAKLDMRVRLWRKHFVSAKTNYARYNDDALDIFDKGHSLFGMGLGYSYETMLGPVEVLVDYSARQGKVGIYAGIGYYF